MWLAQIRMFFAVHRWVYWSIVAAAAVAVGGSFVAQSRQLADARASWGATIVVWVAADDTPAGTPVRVEARDLPASMVPADALTGPWPADAVARQQLAAGEVIVAHDVGRGRLVLLPDGWRAVALVIDQTGPEVQLGDRVDVVAVGAVLAADGVVVQTTDGVAMVGVPAEVAATVAAAALDRTATLTVRG